MGLPITGGCACGKVRYTADARPITALYCQCRDCQYDSGTGHSCHIMLPEAALVTSGTLTSYWSKAESGNAVCRQFCPVCGSSITYSSTAFAGRIFVTAGSLDDLSLFVPVMVVYTESAAPWDVVNARLRRFPRMPPV
jgi:hypothetical protein